MGTESELTVKGKVDIVRNVQGGLPEVGCGTGSGGRHRAVIASGVLSEGRPGQNWQSPHRDRSRSCGSNLGGGRGIEVNATGRFSLLFEDIHRSS